MQKQTHLSAEEMATYLRISKAGFMDKFTKGEYKDMPFHNDNNGVWFDIDTVIAYLDEKF